MPLLLLLCLQMNSFDQSLTSPFHQTYSLEDLLKSPTAPIQRTSTPPLLSPIFIAGTSPNSSSYHSGTSPNSSSCISGTSPNSSSCISGTSPNSSSYISGTSPDFSFHISGSSPKISSNILGTTLLHASTVLGTQPVTSSNISDTSRINSPSQYRLDTLILHSHSRKQLQRQATNILDIGAIIPLAAS